MRRKKKLMVAALAVAVLAVVTAALCIRSPSDHINPETYDRLVKGMSESEVDAMLSPGALPVTVLRGRGSRWIAQDPVDFCVGREITLKQLPNYDAEVYDRNTGEFLGTSRSWRGERYTVSASFDAKGKLSDKQLCEYDELPVTSVTLFCSRVIVAVRGLFHGH
jgi:hypothetical protein